MHVEPDGHWLAAQSWLQYPWLQRTPPDGSVPPEFSTRHLAAGCGPHSVCAVQGRPTCVTLSRLGMHAPVKPGKSAEVRHTSGAGHEFVVETAHPLLQNGTLVRPPGSGAVVHWRSPVAQSLWPPAVAQRAANWWSG
jgi:hypothetical protein